MNISEVQLLIFEIGTRCNLGHVHDKCPNSLGEKRYSFMPNAVPLDDDTVVTVAERFYRDYGFAGNIGWHYYNEPLMYQERMFGLMHRIKYRAQQARFLLWTNGILMPDDKQRLSMFDSIHVTNYGGKLSPRNLDVARESCKNVFVYDGCLDARLQVLGQENLQSCKRPYTEFVVDAYANVHFCCIDWRGYASPGNIYRDSLDVCIARWGMFADKIVEEPMSAEAPEACRKCPMRFTEKTNY